MQKNLLWKCFRTAFGHHDFPSTSASQEAWRMRKRYHLLFVVNGCDFNWSVSYTRELSRLSYFECLNMFCTIFQGWLIYLYQIFHRKHGKLSDFKSENKQGPRKKKVMRTSTNYSLRKHPFLLALRRWGRFERNVPSGEERGQTDVFAGYKYMYNSKSKTSWNGFEMARETNWVWNRQHKQKVSYFHFRIFSKSGIGI